MTGLANKVLHPRICFWNVNGRTRLLKSSYIGNWLKKRFDIIFLTETHLTK